ncbi:hypothetical protein CBL_21073, partial [Carabus blaptoides fortunei]
PRFVNRKLSRPSQSVQRKDLQNWLQTVREFYLKPKINYILRSTAHDNRPYVDINIFGHTLRGLLDSGATRTILGQRGWNILKKCNLPLDEVITQCVVANDTTCTSIGTLELPLRLEQKSCLLKILVVPAIPDELILGVDFWLATEIIPNIST